jgi:hypothetical protein
MPDDRGLPAGPDDGRLETAAVQQFGDDRGGPFDVCVVESGERDPRDADQPFEIGADAGHLPVDRRAQFRLAADHQGALPAGGRFKHQRLRFSG